MNEGRKEGRKEGWKEGRREERKGGRRRKKRRKERKEGEARAGGRKARKEGWKEEEGLKVKLQERSTEAWKAGMEVSKATWTEDRKVWGGGLRMEKEGREGMKEGACTTRFC